MPHNIVSDIDICVHLNMDKPPDNSLDYKDEDPGPNSVKCFDLLE